MLTMGFIPRLVCFFSLAGTVFLSLELCVFATVLCFCICIWEDQGITCGFGKIRGDYVLAFLKRSRLCLPGVVV